MNPEQPKHLNFDGGFFRLDETDRELALHWKSGSLKYSQFKLLKEGGAAKLYSCLDRNLRRRVVYKTLKESHVDDEIELQRFMREARVTANIAHPGTVPLYELGRDRNGVPFFTMKLIHGRDLREVITSLRAGETKTSRIFTLSVMLEIILQVCNVLAYAHNRGVIHRDLKPANILTSQFEANYVIDWGLAKVWGEPELSNPRIAAQEDPGITPVGRRYGTPLYMAPELARGDAQVDARVDVFAIGHLLFETLTHQQLLTGETVDDVLVQLIEKPLPKPSEVVSSSKVPPALEEICLRALEKEPKDRYPDVTSLSDDLTTFLRTFSATKSQKGFE